VVCKSLRLHNNAHAPDCQRLSVSIYAVSETAIAYVHNFFLDVTIAVKIRRSKIFVHPVAIAPKSEKVVCNSSVNAKNVAHHNYFTPIQRINLESNSALRHYSFIE